MIIRTWAELKVAMQTHRTGVFELVAANFVCTEELLLQDKTDIVIRGAGRTKTIIHVRGEVQNCIRIWSGCHGVTISDLAIRGTLQSDEEAELDGPHAPTFCSTDPRPSKEKLCYLPRRGISTLVWHYLDAPDSGGAQRSEYPSDVSRINITRVEISHLSDAVTIGGSGQAPHHRIEDCIISNNYIHHIYGRWSGIGYGIRVFYAPNAQILDNCLFRVNRHAIYLGNGEDPRTTVIVGNRFIDCCSGENPHWVALVIARSVNVTAAHNKFIRSRASSISVEASEDGSVLPDNIRIIGNQFEHGAAPDIWLDLKNAPNAVVIWHNTNVTTADRTATVDPPDGQARIEPALWAGTQSMERIGSNLLIMQHDTLHFVTPDYQVAPMTPDDWPYSIVR